MFINQLHIKNFKCFQDENLDHLATPNGKNGSGLNVLIGENGNGKTTILEAINYLTLDNYSINNKININDFNDFKKSIEISVNISKFECNSSIDLYKMSGWYFEADGIEFIVDSRKSKERNKLLSSSFKSHSYFRIASPNYKGGKSTKPVDSRDFPFSNSRVRDNGLNIFYFDKNRNRQISKGNYKTIFERILDDLNWKFRKELSEENEKEILDNINGEFFKSISSVIGGSAGVKTAKDLSDFFSNAEYNNLKIELLSLLQPFDNAFFAIRKDDDMKQVLLKDLGSGIEIILTILLLKNISEPSSGKIVYLIDEPELHLHPKAQEKLSKLLLEESKDKQIFISTHSPYMFNSVIGEGANLIILKKNKENFIEIKNARNEGWGIFGKYSPTWGEINWFAYDLPTVEFHNELYGFLQAKAINEDEKNYYEENFDDWLFNKIFSATKRDWIRINSDDSKVKCQRTNQTYIRNSIHHPENMENDSYDNPELKNSIKEMVCLIKNFK